MSTALFPGGAAWASCVRRETALQRPGKLLRGEDGGHRKTPPPKGKGGLLQQAPNFPGGPAGAVKARLRQEKKKRGLVPAAWDIQLPKAPRVTRTFPVLEKD